MGIKALTANYNPFFNSGAVRLGMRLVVKALTAIFLSKNGKMCLVFLAKILINGG